MLSLFHSLLPLSFVVIELFSHHAQFIVSSLISHMLNSSRISILSESIVSWRLCLCLLSIILVHPFIFVCFFSEILLIFLILMDFARFIRR